MQNPMLTRWHSLHKFQTKHEKAIEFAVASLGRPYRLSHPMRIGSALIFPDFTLTEDWVVIEVDGPSHSRKGEAERDAERTRLLVSRGYQVVRCTNADVDRDPYATVDRMMAAAGLPYRTRLVK